MRLAFWCSTRSVSWISCGSSVSFSRHARTDTSKVHVTAERSPTQRQVMNTDCKSQANRIWGATVRYQTTRTGGTEHSPIFTSTVSLNDKSYSAIGSSRQDAEQAAAEALLRATNRGEYWLHTAAESTVVPDVMVTPLAPPSPGPVKLDLCNPTCFGYASPTGWDLHHSRSRPAVALVIDYGTVRYAPKAQYMPGVQIFPLLKAAT